MKNIYKFLSLVMLILVSTNLYAERDSGLYLGLKTGVLEADYSGPGSIDDDNPIGLLLGYDWGGLAIQGEYYSAENDVSSGGEIETDVLGVYGVFRTSGFIYFLGKAGMVQGESEITGVPDEDDTAFSYGIGAGLNLGDFFDVEAEYLIFEVEDVDVDFIGVSAFFKF